MEAEDALATLQAFRDMGVQIEGPVNGCVTIHGVGKHGLKAPNKSVVLRQFRYIHAAVERTVGGATIQYGVDWR